MPVQATGFNVYTIAGGRGTMGWGRGQILQIPCECVEAYGLEIIGIFARLYRMSFNV